ncbi:hypothetical protein CRE_11952 [Caenorhabditis remanei]|uniref:Skp1-related protein n=1 Tax=Caenorhabditis remanei TaxID=31234 RepID=E3M4N7_CAERE|nr:hypothetical protein CRE_11952 [Caenorhabditis remanei]
MSLEPEVPIVQIEEVKENPVLYKIISSDNHVFTISEHAVKLSKTLWDLITNLGLTAENALDNPIPVENVNGKNMERIVQFCERHKYDEEEQAYTNFIREFVVPEWDRQLLSIDNEELFQLILATNYLDIPKLMDYCCRVIGDMAKEKTPEELRIIYGIPTDAEDDALERSASDSPGPSG